MWRRTKKWDKDELMTLKNSLLGIEMEFDQHHNGISLHLSATTNQTRSEPKEWKNSVKANSIKVDSTVPGVKYYGNNLYGEYQIKNPHQQSQNESNYSSFGRYQQKEWN